MVSLIVAEAHDRVIGRSNDLPWYLPADLKRFKELTTGHSVVMGRKTYDSIFARLGKPLPNRTNIVITRNPEFGAEGVMVARSLPEALEKAGDGEVFVIGGASVYKEAVVMADRIYKTFVDTDISGDAFFPEMAESEWKEVQREHHMADEKNPYAYDYVTFERVRV